MPAHLLVAAVAGTHPVLAASAVLLVVVALPAVILRVRVALVGALLVVAASAARGPAASAEGALAHPLALLVARPSRVVAPIARSVVPSTIATAARSPTASPRPAWVAAAAARTDATIATTTTTEPEDSLRRGER